jgi:sporulation protein YlmC with PRC-barrel domain
MIYSLILLNKPVIDSDKNEKIGRVKGFVIDPEEKKVIAFILAPDAEKGTLHAIPFSSVKSLYDNAVIIENLPGPLQMADVPEILSVFLKDIAIIGAQVITDSGMLAGSVRDFAISEKDGSIQQLSLVPERPSVPRIDAKYIIKVTQSRIMVSGTALEDVPPPPKKAEPPESRKPKAGPDAETPEIGAETQPPAAPQSGEPGVAPPSRENPEKHQPPKARDGAEPDKSETAIKALVGESFLEMSRILIGRINAIDPAEAISNLKNELLDALKSIPAAETSGEDAGPASELLLEEKIKRGISKPIEELKSELSKLKEIIETKATAKPPDIKIEPPDLSPVKSAIESIQSGIAAKIGDLADRISKIPAPQSNDVLRSAVDELAASLDSLRVKIPTKEDMRGQLLDYGNRFEERNDALNKMFRAELDRHAQATREEITRSLLEEMKTSAAGLTELEKSLRSSIEKKLEGAAGAFKGELDRMAAAVRDAITAQTSAMNLPQSAPDFSELEKTMQSLIEDFRDQFATQLAVELGEQRKSEQTGAEQRLEASLKEIISPVSAGAAAAGAEAKTASDGIRALGEKLEARLALWADAHEKWPEKIRESILNDLKPLDDIKSAVGRVSHELKTLSEKIPKPAAAEEISAKLENIERAVADTIESKLAERADFAAHSIDELRDFFRETDNRIVELREHVAADKTEIENTKQTILDEIRSYADTTLKPEDLQIVQQWVRELIPDIGDSVVENIRGVLRPVKEELSQASEESRRHLLALNELLGRTGNDVINLKEEFRQIAGDTHSRVENLKEDLRLSSEQSIQQINSLFERIGQTDGFINNLKNELKSAIDNSGGRIDSIFGKMDSAGDELKKEMERAVGGIAGIFEEKMAALPERERETRELLGSLGREIAEHARALGERIEERWRETSEKQAAEREGLNRRWDEALEKAAGGLRLQLATGLDAAREELAGLNDIEQIRERIEARVGGIIDEMVGRIEFRLDKRDLYYEEGVQSISSSLEKLIKRGLRPDFEGLFSGGGLISNLFSGRQNESPMKLTGPAPKARTAKSSTVEDSQIRRFAYLLGKKLKKDIVDAEGNTLAEEGAVVDEALIRGLRDKQCTLELIRAVDFNE